MKQNPALVKVANGVLKDGYVIELLCDLRQVISEPLTEEIGENADKYPLAWGFNVLSAEDHEFVGVIMWDWGNEQNPVSNFTEWLEEYL